VRPILRHLPPLSRRAGLPCCGEQDPSLSFGQSGLSGDTSFLPVTSAPTRGGRREDKPTRAHDASATCVVTGRNSAIASSSFGTKAGCGRRGTTGRFTPLAVVFLLQMSSSFTFAQTADISNGVETRMNATAIRGSTTLATNDPSALWGLVEPAGGRVALTLEQLLEDIGKAPDSRVARERVSQGEVASRRSWALLLPTLSLSGVYTHTCTGGLGGIDCADRTANVGDPKAIEQQVLLFRSIADIFGAAADAAVDPDDAARLRAQQADLAGAADEISGRASSPPIVVQPASQAAGQLTLAVPLLNPRAYTAVMNASDSVHIARLGVWQAEQALALAVVRGYYAAFVAQRIVAASKKQRDLAEQQRSAVAARVAAATQPPLALKRAELELVRAQQTLTQATAAADNAIAALGAALGRSEMFAIAPPSSSVASIEADENTLVQRGLRARVELQVQRLAVVVAERGTLDAWLQYLPTVGLSATARATTFTSGFVRDPVTGVVSVTATLPLYDGGLRSAAMDDAASRTSEERIRLQQLEERVAAQVRGSLRDVAVRADSVRLASGALVVATEAHAQAQALFSAGVGTALDVSETAVALFAAETEALRAEGDFAVARLSLRWVLGEPLFPTADDPS
jgi:outer membrane protein TolC